MTEDMRDQISRMIAQLHDLYRTGSRQEWVGGIESLRDGVNRLTELSQTASPTADPLRAEPPGIVTTRDKPPLHRRLASHMAESRIVRIATAFLSASDANPLILPLRELVDRGGQVQILTSLMGFFNRPDALQAFLEWSDGLELRLYIDDQDRPEDLLLGSTAAFHAKAFLFEKAHLPSVIAIGSANLTAAGLGENIEWNYISDFEVNSELAGHKSPFERATTLFDRLWADHGYIPDGVFLRRYGELHDRARALHRQLSALRTPDRSDAPSGRPQSTDVAPRPSQQAALRNLDRLRKAGADRCAVIAATGTGKTFLSAFDVRNSGAERVLFLAHRETIIDQAMETFQRVIPGAHQLKTAGAQALVEINTDTQHLFAMVQTLGREENVQKLSPDFFDYVIVDEFHHAAAESYRRVLKHFRPKFLLGLTATPERMDGQDVLELCDRNVAYELRLLDAIQHRWLCPFHYYALFDPTDYEQVQWNAGRGYDEEQLQIALSQDTRADLIVKNVELFQPESGKRKCLAFCSNVGHAKWMARAFVDRGIPATVLIGQTPGSELEIVCAVDVLNEGVDVPSLTHVLLLRPTDSFAVFIQQLGRGLRLHPGKSFVTVLDFVGNYRKSFVAPLALQGFSSPPPTIARSKPTDEFQIPAGCSVIVDKRVERLWEAELESIIRRAKPIDRIRLLLDELARDDEGGASMVDVTLSEFFTQADSKGVSELIRKCGGWLSVRTALGIANAYETKIADGPGAEFLLHIEQELNAVKSYKMAVLRALLDLDPPGDRIRTEWPVLEIAEQFLLYYESDGRRRADWDELDRHDQPELFPIEKAEAHIKRMPLHFLSDTDEKHFVLDSNANVFSLKAPLRPFWADPKFRALVAERVEYAEARYWYRFAKKQTQEDSRDTQ